MENKHITNFCFNVDRNMSYNNFIDMLKKACKEDLNKTILVLFYIRNPRGGKGERRLFRWGLQWLGLNFPNIINNIIHLIPEYGRWDDIYCLFPQKLDVNRPDNYLTESINKNDVMTLQRNIILLKINQLIEDEKKIINNDNDISYCAKWCVTENSSENLKFNFVDTTCKVWNITPREYRRRISKIRKKYKLIETYLTNRKIYRIKYNKLTVGAMKKYKKKLNRYDTYRFNNYKYKLYDSLKDKFDTTKLDDILDLYKNTNLLENKWNTYNEYIKDHQKLQKTVLVVDTNGSMYSNRLKNINIVIKLCLLVIEYSIFTKNIIPFDVEPSYYNNRLDVKEDICSILQLSRQYRKHINLENIAKLIISSGEIPERIIILTNNKIEEVDPKWKQHIDNMSKLFEGMELPTIIYISLQNDMKYKTYENLICIENNSDELFNLIIKDKNVNINNIVENIINDEIYDNIREELI